MLSDIVYCVLKLHDAKSVTVWVSMMLKVFIIISVSAMSMNVNNPGSESTLGDNWKINSVAFSYVGVFIASCVLLCDLLLDHYVLVMFCDKDSGAKYSELLIFERYAIIAGLSMPTVAYFANSIYASYMFETIQTMLIGAMGCRVILREPVNVNFSSARVNAIYFFLFAGELMSIFSMYGQALAYVKMVFHILFAFTFLYCFAFYIRSIKVRRELGPKCTKECVRLMFVLSGVFFILSTIIPIAIFPGQQITDSGCGYLVYIKVCSAICCQPMVIIAGRVSKSLMALAEKELDVKSRFIRYIVHELRIPITIAHIGVDATISELAPHRSHICDPALLDETINATKYSMKIASEILNDVSTLEKLNSHIVILDRALVEISSFVVATVRIFFIEAKRRCIHLDISGCLKPEFQALTVSIDGPKIAQVIRNLVSNAMKFTSSGGLVVISLRLMSSEDIDKIDYLSNISRHFSSMFKSPVSTDISVSQYIRIEVKDAGSGMTDREIEQLFGEMFDEEKNKRGLGIFIARELVKLHNGRLGAFSPGRNEGSIFYVDLPLKDFSSEVRVGYDKTNSAKVEAINDDEQKASTGGYCIVDAVAAIELSELTPSLIC